MNETHNSGESSLPAGGQSLPSGSSFFANMPEFANRQDGSQTAAQDTGGGSHIPADTNTNPYDSPGYSDTNGYQFGDEASGTGNGTGEQGDAGGTGAIPGQDRAGSVPDGSTPGAESLADESNLSTDAPVPWHKDPRWQAWQEEKRRFAAERQAFEQQQAEAQARAEQAQLQQQWAEDDAAYEQALRQQLEGQYWTEEEIDRYVQNDLHFRGEKRLLEYQKQSIAAQQAEGQRAQVLSGIYAQNPALAQLARDENRGVGVGQEILYDLARSGAYSIEQMPQIGQYLSEKLTSIFEAGKKQGEQAALSRLRQNHEQAPRPTAPGGAPPPTAVQNDRPTGTQFSRWLTPQR